MYLHAVCAFEVKKKPNKVANSTRVRRKNAQQT